MSPQVKAKATSAIRFALITLVVVLFGCASGGQKQKDADAYELGVRCVRAQNWPCVVLRWKQHERELNERYPSINNSVEVYYAILAAGGTLDEARSYIPSYRGKMPEYFDADRPTFASLPDNERVDAVRAHLLKGTGIFYAKKASDEREYGNLDEKIAARRNATIGAIALSAAAAANSTRKTDDPQQRDSRTRKSEALSEGARAVLSEANSRATGDAADCLQESSVSSSRAVERGDRALKNQCSRLVYVFYSDQQSSGNYIVRIRQVPSQAEISISASLNKGDRPALGACFSRPTILSQERDQEGECPR